MHVHCPLQFCNWCAVCAVLPQLSTMALHSCWLLMCFLFCHCLLQFCNWCHVLAMFATALHSLWYLTCCYFLLQFCSWCLTCYVFTVVCYCVAYLLCVSLVTAHCHLQLMLLTCYVLLLICAVPHHFVQQLTSWLVDYVFVAVCCDCPEVLQFCNWCPLLATLLWWSVTLHLSVATACCKFATDASFLLTLLFLLLLLLLSLLLVLFLYAQLPAEEEQLAAMTYAKDSAIAMVEASVQFPPVALWVVIAAVVAASTVIQVLHTSLASLPCTKVSPMPVCTWNWCRFWCLHKELQRQNERLVSTSVLHTHLLSLSLSLSLSLALSTAQSTSASCATLHYLATQGLLLMLLSCCVIYPSQLHCDSFWHHDIPQQQLTFSKVTCEVLNAGLIRSTQYLMSREKDRALLLSLLLLLLCSAAAATAEPKTATKTSKAVDDHTATTTAFTSTG